jgi:hypothetical protein
MQVEEISLVDKPASPEAKTTFWKRDFSAEQREDLAEEGKALPDGSYPIVTVDDLRNAIQAFGRADNKSEVADHIARRARALDAEDELPENGKLAEMIGKSTNEEMSMEPEELEKRLESLEAVAKAGPAEARYMAEKDLDLDAKVEFMGKSDEDRMAVLKSEGYVDQEDVEKSDLPEDVKKRFEDLEKRAEEAEKIAKAEREAREFDNLKKRAESDYPHLPKDAETKAKVLKAIESADEDVAKAAKEILDGANEVYGSVYKERGVTGGDEEGSALDKLNKKASEYASEHNVDFAKAYAQVIQTPEGEELYTKSLEEAH